MARGPKQADLHSLMHRVFRERTREPQLVLERLRRHWPQIVGEEVAGRTAPTRLAKGTLWITAADASWAYELQFFKAELLNAVQVYLESESIRDLRLQAGPVEQPGPPEQAAPAPARPTAAEAPPPAPARATAAPAVPDAGNAPTPAPEAPPALVKAAEAIGDPQLRTLFERSLAKQRARRDAQARHGAAAAPPPPSDDES